MEIARSAIKGGDLGIRYWDGAPYIHHNTITGNRTGIFCRQGADGSRITMNNIHGNTEYDLKLGDAQTADIDAAKNWWGDVNVSSIRLKIYDKGRDMYIGRALIEPVLRHPVEAR